MISIKDFSKKIKVKVIVRKSKHTKELQNFHFARFIAATNARIQKKHWCIRG